MAKKPRSPAADYAVYLAVRLLVCGIQAAPPAWAFRFAELLAWIAYKIDKRHREVAADNLRHAFPEWAADPAKIDRLVRGCYQHFCRVVMEIILIPRKLHVNNWRRYATLAPGGKIVPHLLRDRPLLIVTGHFGNWEMAGFALGLFGFKTFAIARVLDNPHLEAFFKRFRQGTGQTIIAKKDDFDRLAEVMKGSGKVATLADQDAGPKGVFVDYFGRPASTHKAVALMAIQFDAVMAVIGVPRVGGGADSMYYAIECEDVIDPREYTGGRDPVRAITERYTAALERIVRRHPEQYFWLHRRWKSQPAAKKANRPAAAKAA